MSARTKLNESKKTATTKIRQLVIEIPEDDADVPVNDDKANSVSSSGMQNGEENLVPSTEKKNNNRTKLNAYSIPQSGAGLKLMMTSASNAGLNQQ